MTQADKSLLRLMVVDDESDNLDLLYRTFRREFEVFRADSALKALQILQQVGEMAIIISDQRMPKMSGIEFLSRTVEPFPDTIRIVLTGYTDVEDLVGAINTGKVFKYITKPWNPEQLKSVVQQAAETYRVVKQRTRELSRALRRESLFNAVTTAIRESLDYRSMLQTIVETIGHTFAADACSLRPIELISNAELPEYRLLPDCYAYPEAACKLGCPELQGDRDKLDELLQLALTQQQPLLNTVAHQGETYAELIVPLRYQQESLALLLLYRQAQAPPWVAEEVELLQGVAEQAALALSQAKLYQRIQEQTEQMRTELAVARQIQTNLLRQQLPNLEGIRIQACCYPAREVGGDFFEVYAHPLGDLWLAVGDVSGKGVPAALFMASAISVLRRELSQESPPEPHQVMRNLNRTLSEDLVSSNRFITLVLARYTPATQQLVYANAGHIYPLVWSQRRVPAETPAADAIAHDSDGVTRSPTEPTYLEVRGVPLGILPEWQAPAGQTTLRSNDVLLLTSDGVTEATIAHTSRASAMLRQAGLWQLLQAQDDLNLNCLLAQIQAHTKVQEDDQTILSLEVL